MKKIAQLSLVALLGAMLFSACKKDYKCTFDYDDEIIPNVVVDYPDLTNDQAKTAKTTCVNSGGVWSTK